MPDAAAILARLAELESQVHPSIALPATNVERELHGALWDHRRALIAAAESLDEILDYSGGADSALEDEYVMDRAVAALALLGASAEEEKPNSGECWFCYGDPGKWWPDEPHIECPECGASAEDGGTA